jgi:hypothetical protein
MYYLGGTSGLDGGGSTTLHSLQYGVELGYGFKLLRLLTIRPQIGIGNYTAFASVNGLAVGPTSGPTISGSSSQSTLYLEPGVTALASVGLLFAGVDLNLLVLPNLSTTDPSGNQGSTTDVAFTAHAQVGVRF